MSGGRTDPDRELAEARVDAAADARRRRRRARELQAEESTVRGLLAGLVDTGWSAVVIDAEGRRMTGTVVELGADVVVVETSSGRMTALRAESVVAIELPAAWSGGGTVDEPMAGRDDRTFGDLLADFVGSGIAVSVQAGATRLDGVVVGVGRDVLIVEAGGPQTIYVALDSVSGVTWSSSPG